MENTVSSYATRTFQRLAVVLNAVSLIVTLTMGTVGAYFAKSQQQDLNDPSLWVWVWVSMTVSAMVAVCTMASVLAYGDDSDAVDTKRLRIAGWSIVVLVIVGSFIAAFVTQMQSDYTRCCLVNS